MVNTLKIADIPFYDDFIFLLTVNKITIALATKGVLL